MYHTAIARRQERNQRRDQASVIRARYCTKRREGWSIEAATAFANQAHEHRTARRAHAALLLKQDPPMDRLTEKLKAASGVVLRATKKIEERADAMIAREGDLDQKTQRAFAPHESILSTAESDLQKLEEALGQVTNAPLDHSTGS